MSASVFETVPAHATYDVVIIGGAMIGSSSAWWLSQNPDFDGRVLVVEMDPLYANCSTAHTNSCIRQQFSSEVNIRISQFGAEFINNFRQFMGNDPDVPDIVLQNFGYMYLADNEAFAEVLTQNQKIQSALGAGTRILSRDELSEQFPFYRLDDIICASYNTLNEGYFDGATIFDWWKRKARQNGVEYINNKVVAIDRDASQVSAVTLESGERVSAGTIVNCSGPRAAVTAAMAGLEIPVEPRKRFTFIFDASEDLGQTLPLTIDPGGVHMRQDGAYFMCGCPPDDDQPPAFDDFEMDHSLWEEKLWPALANRVPGFEAIKLINSWAGHYAFNLLDHNAVIGPHHEVGNFVFANGFSGHGLQQSPAMGRGVCELITYGEFRSIDLSPLGYERIAENRPHIESAII